MSGQRSALLPLWTGVSNTALTSGSTGFSFGVSTRGNDINFTVADIFTATAPYIFAGNSLFGPDINTTSGASLIASDFSADPAGVDVLAANTVGLGRLLFDVAPGAAGGPHLVTVTPSPTTSLSDSSGNDVPITTLVDGAILVNAGQQSVPEPAALCSAAVVLVVGACVWARGRRSRILPG